MSKIYVVGIGPGSIEDMTNRAKGVLVSCNIIIGYTAYIDLIKDYFPGKEFISTGMRGEVERCKLAMKKAEEGNVVAIVSSGDSGIYGMAGLMLEIVGNRAGISIEVIPGITAASSAGAILGAPLMHDFAVISLSDCLTPWDVIHKRIANAAWADFIICFYNPKSNNRNEYIGIARDEIFKHRPAHTPVGIVWNASRKNQKHVVTDLQGMLDYDIDMFSTIIIGNTNTYVKNGRMITPRGYVL